MTTPERYFRRLLAILRGDYVSNWRDVVRSRSFHPGHSWMQFQSMLTQTFQWANLLSAQQLRWQAHHEKIRLYPDAVDEMDRLSTLAEQDMSRGKLPGDLWRARQRQLFNEVASAAPWTKVQQETMNPTIHARSRAVADVEAKFLASKAATLDKQIREIERKPEAEQVVKAAEIPIYRIELIRRQSLGEIHEVSQQVALKDPDIGNAFPYAEYHSREDRRVRPTHAAMSGFCALRTWDGWTKARPLAGFNCFVSGTIVSGSFSAASEAVYSGEIIHIETRRGNYISVTPNHPILTDTGWIAANMLNEGDTLFSHRIGVNPLSEGNVNDEHCKSRIENVFNSLWSNRKSGSFANRHASPLEFHGDARFFDSDIRVVSVDSQLMNSVGPQFDELSVEYDFVYGFSPSMALVGLSGLDFLMQGNFLSNMASVESFNDVGGGFRSFDSLPEKSSFLRLRANHSRLSEYPSDGSSAVSAIFGEQEHGFSSGVSADDFVGVHSRLASPHRSRNLVRLGIVPNWDAATAKKSEDGSGVHAEFLRHLVGGSSGDVSADKIVGIRRTVERNCHVYDLESESGWLSAGGIISSNCRCTLGMVTKKQAIAMGWADTKGEPKWTLKWPNSASEKNWKEGKFPDKGWWGPKEWAVA